MTDSAFRTILAALAAENTSQSMLRICMDIAKIFNSHVDVLYLDMDPRTAVPAVGEGLSAAMMDQMIETLEKAASERKTRAHAAYDAICRDEESNLTVRWHETTDGPKSVAYQGRLADLIIAARPFGDAEAPLEAVLDSALFDSGRPVLVTPPDIPGSIGQRIIVAWNGSAQSARAVSASLPFLRMAESVTIAVAEDADKMASSAGLSTMLGRHGIRTHIIRMGAKDGGIADSLEEECEQMKADLLVMGAYGHSRLREMILGGVTRRILNSARIPVFMAH